MAEPSDEHEAPEPPKKVVKRVRFSDVSETAPPAAPSSPAAAEPSGAAPPAAADATAAGVAAAPEPDASPAQPPAAFELRGGNDAFRKKLDGLFSLSALPAAPPLRGNVPDYLVHPERWTEYEMGEDGDAEEENGAALLQHKRARAAVAGGSSGSGSGSSGSRKADAEQQQQQEQQQEQDAVSHRPVFVPRGDGHAVSHRSASGPQSNTGQLSFDS
eukprot:m51a1_g1235 hypothetical protein (216) ;mRNA; r:545070-545778